MNSQRGQLGETENAGSTIARVANFYQRLSAFHSNIIPHPESRTAACGFTKLLNLHEEKVSDQGTASWFVVDE